MVRLSSSGSELSSEMLSLRSEMSLVSNQVGLEMPSRSNHTSQERPCKIVRASTEEMPFGINSTNQKNCNFVPNVPPSKTLMKEAPVLDAVNYICSDELSYPYKFSSVDSDSMGIQYKEGLRNWPLSQADLSFPGRQRLISEQSPKFQRGDSDYHSGMVSNNSELYKMPEILGKRAVLMRRQELNKLRKENIRLNKKMNMMRQRHLITKKNLKKKKLYLINKLEQLQWCCGNMRRISEPSKPMTEVFAKGRQREPLSPAPKNHSIVMLHSTTGSALEKRKVRASKMEFLGQSRTSAQKSPMESRKATVNQSNLADMENEALNRSQFEKKIPQSVSSNRVKRSSGNKREFSPKAKNCVAQIKSNGPKVAGKTGLQKRCKADKDQKVLKSPVFDFTNLIINYLPPEMDSSLLQMIFAPYGEIVSCKVVMDHKTSMSKGYGFVKFKRKEQAKLAVEKLNKFHIGGKVLKVAYARRNEGGKYESKQTNLYVANLDKNVETSDIKRMFSKCGYVVQCKVLKNLRGVTRRIGFVRFDTNESALRAINRYDGKKMEGTTTVIRVRFANVPQPPRSCVEVTPKQLSSPVQYTPQFFSQSILQDDFPRSRTQFCFDTQRSFVPSHSSNIENPSASRKHILMFPYSVGVQNTQKTSGPTFNDFTRNVNSRNFGAACLIAGKPTIKTGELGRMFAYE